MPNLLPTLCFFFSFSSVLLDGLTTVMQISHFESTFALGVCDQYRTFKRDKPYAFKPCPLETNKQ